MKRILFIALLALSPVLSAEESDWKVTVGAAPLMVPEYEGSDAYRVIPVPLLDIKYQDKYFFSPYTGLGANVIHTPTLKVGPMMTYRLWQDEDDNPKLEGLGDIPGTLEVGGFVHYNIVPWLRLTGNLRQGVNGHKGAIGDVSANFLGKLCNDKMFYGIGPRVSWASHDYMQTYFAIDANQSERSDLPVFKIGSGIKDVGLGGSFQYFFNEHWNAGAFGHYARLVHEVAESPIVKTGSPNQYTLALTVAYVF